MQSTLFLQQVMTKMSWPTFVSPTCIGKLNKLKYIFKQTNMNNKSSDKWTQLYDRGSVLQIFSDKLGFISVAFREAYGTSYMASICQPLWAVCTILPRKKNKQQKNQKTNHKPHILNNKIPRYGLPTNIHCKILIPRQKALCLKRQDWTKKDKKVD